MFGYVTALRTMSSGRATSTMEFSNMQSVQKELRMMLSLNLKENKLN